MNAMNEAEKVGLPSASTADEARRRCPLDQGYFREGNDEDGCCDRCGRTPEFYEARLDPAGRYHVSGVWLDCVPQDLAATATLKEAIEVQEAAEEAWKVPGRADPVLLVCDREDEERGYLAADDYDPARDAGPDPH